jgi:hypothetical protein
MNALPQDNDFGPTTSRWSSPGGDRRRVVVPMAGAVIAGIVLVLLAPDLLIPGSGRLVTRS